MINQNNVRPHTTIVICQKLRELGWEVLIYPQYSPYLAPSNYHRFLSLQNILNDKKLASEFFANRDQNFHEATLIKW